MLDCAVVLPGCACVYTTLANTYSYTSWPSKIGAMMTKCLWQSISIRARSVDAICRLLNRNQWYQVRPRSTTPGLKKSGKTSLCCKLTPNHARNIGFSISHRGPKTHNPRTQVLYVVPHPTQTTVIPGTHALVGVVPSTTSQRNTTPKRAARHMHGLTSSTAPTVGEVEVLVWPPRSTPESRTSYYLRVPE